VGISDIGTCGLFAKAVPHLADKLQGRFYISPETAPI
jgi:hypothetical protein